MAKCTFPITLPIILSIIILLITSTNKTSSALAADAAAAAAVDDDTFTKTHMYNDQHFVIQMPKNLQAMLHSDANRQHMILHKQSVIKKHERLQHIAKIRRELVEETKNNASSKDNSNLFAQMPMHSGADIGIGQYLVAFKAGTPSQRFRLIVDTGSDLTWIKCNYNCGKDPNKCNIINGQDGTSAVFEADHSSSFDTIPCSSEMCKVDLASLFSLAICPLPLTPCAFDYRYSDGSSAVGFFANETVTIGLTNGRKAKLENVLMGCSQSSQGLSFRGELAPDGVLGLGFSKSSFAIKATETFGGKFSYCLPDHLSPENISSYLTFSSAANHDTDTKMIHTTLGAISSFYAVNVRGISVGDEMLSIPGEIWDVKGVGGAILDTGSSLTYLTLPAYKPVVAALTVTLNKFQRLNFKSAVLQYCFNATGFDKSLDVPRLIFHFQDGTRFVPPVKSYVIDAAEGVKCLGLVPTAWPGVSVIGNIMQQNHMWEFDLVNGKLGFAPSSCS